MLQILWFKKCYLAVNATEENEQEEIEMSLISKLYDFVENKGRFEKGREPVYGEPFYHDYAYQLIKSKYEIGDRLRVESEDGTIEGIMISFVTMKLHFLLLVTKFGSEKMQAATVLTPNMFVCIVSNLWSLSKRRNRILI